MKVDIKETAHKEYGLHDFFLFLEKERDIINKSKGKKIVFESTETKELFFKYFFLTVSGFTIDNEKKFQEKEFEEQTIIKGKIKYSKATNAYAFNILNLTGVYIPFELKKNNNSSLNKEYEYKFQLNIPISLKNANHFTISSCAIIIALTKFIIYKNKNIKSNILSNMKEQLTSEGFVMMIGSNFHQQVIQKGFLEGKGTTQAGLEEELPKEMVIPNKEKMISLKLDGAFRITYGNKKAY